MAPISTFSSEEATSLAPTSYCPVHPDFAANINPPLSDPYPSRASVRVWAQRFESSCSVSYRALLGNISRTVMTMSLDEAAQEIKRLQEENRGLHEAVAAAANAAATNTNRRLKFPDGAKGTLRGFLTHMKAYNTYYAEDLPRTSTKSSARQPS